MINDQFYSLHVLAIFVSRNFKAQEKEFSLLYQVVIKGKLFCDMLTCPGNVDPLTPHSYIVTLGFTGVYIIFLFLL